MVVEGVCRGERKWVGVVKGKTGRWGEWDVVSEGVGDGGIGEEANK